MKIKYNKIVAVLLTLSLLIFGGGILYITANTEIDENINQSNLGYSGSKVDSDHDRLNLGASGGVLIPDEELPDEPDVVEVAPLGLSVSSFGTYATKHNGSDSIGNVNILPADISKVLIVPATNGVGDYQSFPGTVAGLANAVYELNQNGGGKDYVLYIGSDINVPNGHSLTAEAVPDIPSATNASFSSLKTKVNTLTITGSRDDLISTATINPDGAKTLTLTGNAFFGSNIKLRNIKHSIASMFMLGNSVTLDGGSYSVTNSSIYGGSNMKNSGGNPVITINSTGLYPMSIYGGNNSGATFTGNPTIIVNDSSRLITTIVGGSNFGKVEGNVTINVNKIKESLTNILGGSNTGDVTGDVKITISGVASGIGSFYGGAYSGNVGGNITTKINGVTGNITNFYGGSFKGDVGRDITTTIDGVTGGISNFYGSSSVGSVGGNVTNTISGVTGNIGSIYSGGSGTAANTANVVGNISTDINNLGGTFNNYYGGVYYGNVGGDITTTINGVKGNISNFYGGSFKGDVDRDITTTISGVTGGISNFYGSSSAGSVGGNVTNTISGVTGNTTNIYGGGYGTGTAATATANVGGNVSTTINNLGGTFYTYYGGVLYGNVGGSITNVLGGTGGSAGVAYYYGGSREGDIGGSLTSGMDAINTTFDSSNFSTGSIWFYGANENKGIIRGNIKNHIIAGTTDKGALRAVSGAGAVGTKTVGVGHYAFKANNTIWGEVISADAAQQIAKSKAHFQVYGSIDTEITKGIVSYGGVDCYTRGAGWGGYIEGDVTVVVGTEGLVTSIQGANITDLEPSGIKGRGYNSLYGVSGGGGTEGDGNIIFIKGNTTNIMKNVLARWTYGGNYSGSITGNTSIELHKGIVDTLEGGGRNGLQTWGGSSASLYGGQVDWFLAGGGWNDNDIMKDVSVYIEKGQINAVVGGTYGDSTAHKIHGNSTITIKGGTFAGAQVSGGPSVQGTIAGNTELTIDLRDSNGTFSALSNAEFTAGRNSKGSPPTIGTNAANKITLNLFADATSANALEPFTFNADAGSGTQTSTKSGIIIINVDAPDSNLGNLFATRMTNADVSGATLIRDVTFNIKNAKSIKGMSGGSGSDNFQNSSASTNVNKVRMNFNQGAATTDPQKTFLIGGAGAVNFTEFNVNNAIVVATGSNGIKNGRLSNLTGHATTYYGFGDIKLSNNAELSIGTTSTAIISGNMLTIEGKNTITSPAGSGKVIFTDITMGPNDSLHWAKNGGTALASEDGTWFGKNLAYKAITFNPVRENAEKLTPYNFSGSDGNKKLIGDNEVVFDTTTANSGHGILVSSKRVDFKVVGGNGSISHNVDKVLQGAATPLNGASSVGKDVSTQEGWLDVVASYSGAQLTFTPDASTGSWVQNVKVTNSEGVVTNTVVPPSASPYSWKLPNDNDSYLVEVTFSNESELTGRSVIITEAEAAAITTAEDIMVYQSVSGSPLLTHQITSELIAYIQKPLSATMRLRSHPISYTVGLSGYTKTETYYIGVVREDTVIEMPKRRAAIYAVDVSMPLSVANAMTADDLAANHNRASVLFPNGSSGEAQIDPAAIPTLNSMTEPRSVDVTYSYTWEENPTSIVSKTVKVEVTAEGKIQLVTVPDLMFGLTRIPNVRSDFWLPVPTELVVEDSRSNPTDPRWSVNVKIVEDLKTSDGTKTIPASAVKYTNNDAGIGPTGTFLLDSAAVIWKSTTIDLEDFQTLAWPISTVQGFSIELDPRTAKPGVYTSTATWSIVSSP